uniref:Nonstructural protein n=1 Tax=Parvoviridae sp. TaxID=1940570 RepID=A0A7D3QM74_9VIRU|nr:MAG: nonstructural protein [Parvoviridae sp.]
MSAEMESTGPTIRYYLWVGGFGCSADIPAFQAETFLLEKQLSVTNLNDVERFQALINMKEWQCGIFQINDPQGEPISDPIPYALFLQNLTMCTGWCITGEYNDDGIFHTHAMLKTGSRSDSLRRSMHVVWGNLLLSSEFQKYCGGRSITMDCLKLQRCHKPSSMAEYMMKQPIWVMGTDERMLQFLFDCDAWGLNYRFKKTKDQPEEHETAPDINQMTKELIDLIISSGSKTFEDCLRHGPTTMSKYLHRPGLNQIVTNCLQFVKSTGHMWSLALFEAYDPDPSSIHKVLLHQGILPSDFDPIFHAWINKTDSKRNCICIIGPSNTGKSGFISGLKQIVHWGEIINGQNFMFEGIIDTTIGIWEEPLCSPEAAEKVKQVLEGMRCSIAVKYRKPHMLPRTPIFITTNHELWRYCTAEEEAFRNRMWIFQFNHPVENVPYTPRASEHSCECGYCKGSSGRAHAAGESSPGRMQEPEQPISTEPESLGGEPSSDVWSGSMSGAGEGTSGSTSQPSSSSDQQRTDRTKHSSSSGSSTVGHMGTFRIISTRDDKRRPTTIREYVESAQHRGGHGTDSSRDGSRSSRSRSMGRNGGGRGKPTSSITVGTKRHETDKVPIPTKTKKPRLGGKMGPPKITIPMYVPLPDDWRGYLSYLYHWYG